MSEKTELGVAFIILEVKKALARWAFLGVVGIFLYLATPVWDTVRAIWDSPRALHQIEMQLNDIQGRQLQEIQRSIAQATGEDRVIRMVAGLSYVQEPYVIGQSDPLRFNLTVQRTRLGAQCQISRGVPLFTDENGVTLAGQPLRPSRNIGTTPERLVLDLSPPRRMLAGRMVLILDLQYDCGGDMVNERTDAVVFYAITQEATQ